MDSTSVSPCGLTCGQSSRSARLSCIHVPLHPTLYVIWCCPENGRPRTDTTTGGAGRLGGDHAERGPAGARQAGASETIWKLKRFGPLLPKRKRSQKVTSCLLTMGNHSARSAQPAMLPPKRSAGNSPNPSSGGNISRLPHHPPCNQKHNFHTHSLDNFHTG